VSRAAPVDVLLLVDAKRRAALKNSSSTKSMSQLEKN